MLTKTETVDRIEVVGNNIEVRTATIIAEDGAEISRTYHRHVLTPGADLSGEDARVVAIAGVIW